MDTKCPHECPRGHSKCPRRHCKCPRGVSTSTFQVSTWTPSVYVDTQVSTWTSKCLRGHSKCPRGQRGHSEGTLEDPHTFRYDIETRRLGDTTATAAVAPVRPAAASTPSSLPAAGPTPAAVRVSVAATAAVAVVPKSSSLDIVARCGGPPSVHVVHVDT